MRKFVWVIVACSLIVWSGLAWLAHGLVGWGGNIASSNADILVPHPEAVEWLSWLAIFGTDLVEWMIVGVWALGVAVALVLGVAGTRIVPRLGGLASKLKMPS